MNSIFITGFLRSGTTLLEKLLHNHPQIAIASQPFPFLFYAAKKAFYHHLGINTPHYPLGHLFLNRDYIHQDFLDFMMTYRMSTQEVQSEMEQMRGYSGQLAQGLIDMPVPEGTLMQIFGAYAKHYPDMFSKPTVHYAGIKEVFCEEFIPYFLHHGCPVVLIIRDPRAIVASIHNRQRATYANKKLSVLHILRCWRKSVAYAIRYAEHPQFHLVRYEQLIHSLGDTLQPLTQALNLSPFPSEILHGDLRSQDGTLWNGNSSFDSYMEQTSRYQKLLDLRTIEFVDTFCDAEMNWLGIAHEPKTPAKVIEAFREPFQIEKPVLSSDEKKMELTRLSMITEKHEASISEEEAELWFIFAVAHQVLHQSSSQTVGIYHE